jgi:hypothetical protein
LSFCFISTWSPKVKWICLAAMLCQSDHLSRKSNWIVKEYETLFSIATS